MAARAWRRRRTKWNAHQQERYERYCRRRLRGMALGTHRLAR